MHTLQEFISFTKGWEYIIAIVVIFLFIAFWEVLNSSPVKKPAAKNVTDNHKPDVYPRVSDGERVAAESRR